MSLSWDGPDRVTLTQTQCTEVFRALEQKAVYGPMMVIFLYNLLQVREKGEFITIREFLSAGDGVGL